MSEYYYSKEELQMMGVREVGENCTISKKCSIYSNGGIIFGNNVRIDDFCLLVGNIEIGNYVHIGAFSGLHASQGGKIVFEDFSGNSSNVSIYASSDDFSGEYCTGRPGLPEECTKTISCEIRLGKYSQIGTGSTVIPGGNLGEGTAVGAMSLINKELNPWSIYCGVPCRFMKEREKGLVDKLDKYLFKEK